MDEFTREALALRVERKLTSAEVLETLAELRLAELRLAEFRPDRGVPAHVRSNDGPEFVAQSVQAWIAAQGARTARIEPGSPRENGYVDGLSKPRDALLSREILPSLRHAQILIKGWRRHHNAIRPHSALRRTPPTPKARLPTPQARPPMTLLHQPRQTAINPKAAIGSRLPRPTWPSSSRAASSLRGLRSTASRRLWGCRLPSAPAFTVRPRDAGFRLNLPDDF